MSCESDPISPSPDPASLALGDSDLVLPMAVNRRPPPARLPRGESRGQRWCLGQRDSKRSAHRMAGGSTARGDGVGRGDDGDGDGDGNAAARWQRLVFMEIRQKVRAVGSFNRVTAPCARQHDTRFVIH